MLSIEKAVAICNGYMDADDFEREDAIEMMGEAEYFDFVFGSAKESKPFGFGWERFENKTPRTEYVH